MNYKIMTMSSATMADEILIRANIRALYRSRYHCEAEIRTLQDRMNTKDAKPEYVMAIRERLALRGKTKGCGHTLKVMVDSIGNIQYFTCLCQLKHPLMDDLFYMNHQMKNGIMPCRGGLLDQPAQIIELLKITDDAKTSEEYERDKAQQQKMKGTSNGRSKHRY